VAGKSEPKTSEMLAQKKRSETDETDEEKKKDKKYVHWCEECKEFQRSPIKIPVQNFRRKRLRKTE
jgi:hypothetical protein